MKECPVCHASIDALVDCLLDRQSWENRTIAFSIMESCATCKAMVKEVIKVKAARDTSLSSGSLITAFG